MHSLLHSMLFGPRQSWSQGDIRLAGSGSTRCSGRLEILHNGSWGTVCDDGWDLNDAQVVCRQLDCGTALRIPSSDMFGQGTEIIWLDDVDCSGNENSLTACQHKGFGEHNCGHYEDAGVICSETQISLEGDVRLAGSGSTWCSGRVEIFHNGSWGTVCDDGWDLNDAQAVCRQLDCGTALSAPHSASFGQGTAKIWLDDVDCSGSERSLLVCRHKRLGKHNCGHSKDAGVICSVAFRVTNPYEDNEDGDEDCVNVDCVDIIDLKEKTGGVDEEEEGASDYDFKNLTTNQEITQ
ncbi:putative DMBT1-like protein [Parambassis ranga]|uniref:DMBT1-like protein n=1 Tax=Parambassis ranga TaxID=210632 RepID=A0A6P7IUZ1_9TELE|nr:putative DMBT1-like protein [Parambassis ranga]